MEKNLAKVLLTKKVLLTFMLAGAMVAVTSLATYSTGISGFFSKAFDKSLSPGEHYERNITVRKYYNLSIRFQKEGSSGYLGFTDDDSIVLLKDASGSVVANFTGVNKGRIYARMDAGRLRAVSTASAYSIASYADVIDQPVSISYAGAKAYVTVTVTYRAAAIMGFVVDDLTGEAVEGVEVLAIEDGADPASAAAVVQNISMADGSYVLSLRLNASKALDVYVKDYEVA